MAARHALAAGISKALVDSYGVGVFDDYETTVIAGEVVAYLTRTGTLPLLTRFVLELLADGES